MTFDIAFTLLVVLGVVASLIHNRLPADAAMLGALLVLLLGGLPHSHVAGVEATARPLVDHRSAWNRPRVDLGSSWGRPGCDQSTQRLRRPGICN